MDNRRKLSRTWAVAGLLVSVPAATLVLLAVPRAVAPRELPALALSPRAIDASIEADEEQARRAPDSESARELDRALRAQGVAEVIGSSSELARAVRHARIERAVAGVTRAHGPTGLAAIRARWATDVQALLLGRAPLREREERLGSFPRMLDRYGLAQGGVPGGPPFVIRTLYKARFNAIAGHELTEGMRRVERQAYYGWLVLHAKDAPMANRVEAVSEYERAGGAHADEARASLLFLAGDTTRAARAFARAYERTGNLRLRNHWLAALRSADAE